MEGFFDHILCNACQASKPQPQIMAIPPRGVTAPSHLGPPRASAYSVPEKMMAPPTISQAGSRHLGVPERPRPRTASACHI